MRPLCALLLVVLVGTVGLAQDKPLSQAELAKLPMYERLLKGDDAKKVADLNKKIAEAENAGRIEGAVKLREERLSLRTRVQGADHWQIADEQVYLKTLRTLDAEGRRQRQIASQANEAAVQLYAKGRYAEAAP